MSYANSPPCGEAGSLFSPPGHCNAGPLLKSGIPAWASPDLPQLSAAAELLIINLVAHHDPQPDAEFARSCNPRLAHSFLDEFATIEPFQLRVFPGCMHHCFCPQITQQRIALLAHLSQSLSLSAAVLRGDHSNVTGKLVGRGKTTR